MTKFLDALRQKSFLPEDRVPPGQVVTAKWPVLHYGDVPRVDTAKWTFEVSGLVERPYTLTYDELLALPRKTVQCDMHCVTRWSRLDNAFEGVPVQLLLERAGVQSQAGYCLVLRRLIAEERHRFLNAANVVNESLVGMWDGARARAADQVYRDSQRCLEGLSR